jgi:hypothetical protein
MTRLFLFADEAGCFTFNRNPNVSKYYVICTVTLSSCGVGENLLSLRRELAWERVEMGDYFHASTDRQQIRDRVFAALKTEDFNVQATIMEKSKAQSHVRSSEHRFYQYGWHYHFQYSSLKYLKTGEELHLTIATIGTKKKRTLFEDAVRDVISQKKTNKKIVTNFWSCASDPCLWLADYCTWAIQKKYESNGNELRPYNTIADKINHEYDLWSHGTRHHY